MNETTTMWKPHPRTRTARARAARGTKNGVRAKAAYAHFQRARVIQNKSLETLSDHYFTVISYRTQPHQAKRKYAMCAGA